MVRRDAGGKPLSGSPPARCTSPAGESPAPVSAGAPVSRPQATRGNPSVEAGRQKPVRRQQPFNGERAHGPQHQVKPAASTDQQSGSRADHVTAKAISTTARPEGVVGPGGVWGAARVQGVVRNTRDPSALPWSGQGGSYKSKTKSSAAQRESEGIVVPKIGATNNAAGGKGP